MRSGRCTKATLPDYARAVTVCKARACMHVRGGAGGGAKKQCNDSCTAAHAVRTTTCYQHYTVTTTYHRLKASGGQAGATLGSSRLQPERP